MFSLIFTILLDAANATPDFNAGEAFDTLRQNVPLIGLLWFVCIGLIGAVIKLWTAYQASVKERLTDKDKHAEEISKLIKENSERFDKITRERLEAEEEFRREISHIKQRK